MGLNLEEEKLETAVKKVEVEIPADLLKELEKFRGIECSMSELFLNILKEYVQAKSKQKEQDRSDSDETQTPGAVLYNRLQSKGLLGFLGHRNDDFAERLREAVSLRDPEGLQDLLEEQGE